MKNLLALPIILLLLVLFPSVGYSVLKIDITKGNLDPIPVAVTPFNGDSTRASDIAAKMTKVISQNLVNSGLFKTIDKNAFIEKLDDVSAIPHFPDWRQINAQSLIVGGITDNKDGTVGIKFRLWDVLSGKQFAGKSYKSPEANWRRVAHLISDEIYKRLTGEDAYFDSRIIFISETGHWRFPRKRLAIMDQDGANLKYLTSGRVMVLTPRFDQQSQRIIYLAYYNDKPSVYLYDLESGKEEMIGHFPGMSFAPRFSPDSKKVVMSVASGGNSSIYELDLKTKNQKRLTNSGAIDTSPSYSPDGKKITFNSDRGGGQEIYVMDSDGKNQKRISFGKGSYATPVWSPRGDLIAFTRMSKGKFYIGVMHPDGSGERLLTESYLDEGPTWSPNGRVIMFTRKTPSYGGKAGVSKIYSIDLTGYNEREIETPTEASDPAWSPLLGK